MKNVPIPDSLHKRLMQMKTDTGKSLQILVSAAINEYLSKPALKEKQPK